MPKTAFHLGKINGFSSGQIRKLGQQVIEAVDRAREIGPLSKLPRLPNRDGTSGFSEQEVELHERMKQWRKGAAAAMGIDSAYLVNRHVLLRIVKAPSLREQHLHVVPVQAQREEQRRRRLSRA